MKRRDFFKRTIGILAGSVAACFCKTKALPVQEIHTEWYSWPIQGVNTYGSKVEVLTWKASIPKEFCQAWKECQEGRFVDMDVVLNEPYPNE